MTKFSQQPQGFKSSFPSQNLQSSSSNNVPILTAVSITIPQTMVRENPVTKRPYTEYIIQVLTKSCQWTVARKYRSFCELHNSLTSSYPFVEFPNSAKQLFGMHHNLSQMLETRKSNLIDDRRRYLSSYLKDLLRMEVLRESSLVRSFLEINKYYDQEGRLIVDG